MRASGEDIIPADFSPESESTDVEMRWADQTVHRAQQSGGSDAGLSRELSPNDDAVVDLERRIERARC